MSGQPPPSETNDALGTIVAQDIDWIAPHRFVQLEQLCTDVEAPWSLVPSSRTVTGTIVLHDANGIAIADLYTEGSPTPVDRLIAVAPVAIAQLIAEIRRLRAVR